MMNETIRQKMETLEDGLASLRNRLTNLDDEGREIHHVIFDQVMRDILGKP